MATEIIKYKYTLDSKEAEGTLLSLEGSYKRLGGVIKTFSAGAIGLGAVGFAAADMASDLDEAKNVVVQSLGEMSEEVITWSEDSIKSMGISQTQALKTAGVFANLGTGLGLTSEDAAGMATELTQLSADMASYFNVQQDVAASALKGIFTGESEALKEYGIILNENTLSANGYNDSLSEAEKIQIRYKTVLQQTTAAQGDFQRTSNGLANQSRILQESFKALVTEIGKRLIPVVTSVVSLLNDSLAAAIALVSGDTSKLTQEQQALYDKFTQVIPTIVTIAKIVGALTIAYVAFTVTMAAANVVITTATALQKLHTLATSGQFKAQLALNTALLPYIAVVLGVVAAIAVVIAIILNWTKVTEVVRNVYEALKQYLISWAQSVVAVFTAWAAAVKTIIVGVLNVIKSIFVADLTFILNQTKTTFNAIKTTITGVMNAIKSTIQGVWNGIKDIFSNTLGLIKGIVTGDMNLIKSSIQGIMNAIKGIYQSIWNGIKGIFTSILGGILEFVTGTMDNMQQRITTIMNAISTAISGVLTSISNAFETTFQFIYDNTIGKMLALKDSITGVVGDIGSSISSGLSRLNPFSSSAANVNAFYTPLPVQSLSAGGGGNTEVNYNIYSSAPQMTLKEMHMQAKVAKLRGGK